MKGKIYFSSDEKVTITAFGFDGCVFSSDTATNELFFHLQDSLINMVNDENEVIFSYSINTLEKGNIELSLLNDIHLSLSKED